MWNVILIWDTFSNVFDKTFVINICFAQMLDIRTIYYYISTRVCVRPVGQIANFFCRPNPSYIIITYHHYLLNSSATPLLPTCVTNMCHKTLCLSNKNTIISKVVTNINLCIDYLTNGATAHAIYLMVIDYSHYLNI